MNNLLVTDEVNEHVDERSQWIVKAVRAALDADKAQGYGFGNGKDGDITKGMTVAPTNGSSSRAIIQATSVNLPAGETITTTVPCAGLWIYSHSDIIINGTITMTDKGYYTTNIDSAPDNVIINGESMHLAVCGSGGRSVGGKGGSAHTGSGGTSGGVTQSSSKNHTCGSKGATEISKGGCGYDHCSYVGSSGSTPSTMTNGAGAIVLIAYGDIIINGTIVSNGRSNTSIAPTNGGDAYYSNYNGDLQGGMGGYGGTGGCGGGAVTMIYVGKCAINGTISLNGGSGGGYAKNGADAYNSEGTLKAYGGVGGKGESGSAGSIIKKQVLLS